MYLRVCRAEVYPDWRSFLRHLEGLYRHCLSDWTLLRFAVNESQVLDLLTIVRGRLCFLSDVLKETESSRRMLGRERQRLVCMDGLPGLAWMVQCRCTWRQLRSNLFPITMSLVSACREAEHCVGPQARQLFQVHCLHCASTFQTCSTLRAVGSRNTCSISCPPPG